MILMNALTNSMRDKFLKFHDVYEQNRERLDDEGVSGAVLSSQVWELSLREVPMTSDELHLYKKLVAMHSVNGGELFAPDTN
jgi:hypothetical protein